MDVIRTLIESCQTLQELWYNKRTLGSVEKKLMEIVKNYASGNSYIKKVVKYRVLR